MVMVRISWVFIALLLGPITGFADCTEVFQREKEPSLSKILAFKRSDVLRWKRNILEINAREDTLALEWAVPIHRSLQVLQLSDRAVIIEFLSGGVLEALVETFDVPLYLKLRTKNYREEISREDYLKEDPALFRAQKVVGVFRSLELLARLEAFFNERVSEKTGDAARLKDAWRVALQKKTHGMEQADTLALVEEFGLYQRVRRREASRRALFINEWMQGFYTEISTLVDPKALNGAGLEIQIIVATAEMIQRNFGKPGREGTLDPIEFKNSVMKLNEAVVRMGEQKNAIDMMAKRRVVELDLIEEMERNLDGFREAEYEPVARRFSEDAGLILGAKTVIENLGPAFWAGIEQAKLTLTRFGEKDAHPEAAGAREQMAGEIEEFQVEVRKALILVHVRSLVQAIRADDKNRVQQLLSLRMIPTTGPHALPVKIGKIVTNPEIGILLQEYGIE